VKPADLFAALAGVPHLEGARCLGRPHLFDPVDRGERAETVAERHRQALGLCQQCPALALCRTWVESLPASRRPSGVVAGEVYGEGVAGRPRKTAS
jgi:hypothetical protein